MKLVTFEGAAGGQIGCLYGTDHILAFQQAFVAGGLAVPPFLGSMLAFIQAGDEALAFAQTLVRQAPAAALLPRSSVRLLAPIPQPPRLRSMSSYPKHLDRAQEGRARILAAREEDPEAAFQAARQKFVQRPPPGYFETPVYWIMDHLCVAGPDDDVIWPGYSTWIDYELEIVAVIGKSGKDICRDDANDYIFGYTLLNDLSARDEQARASATSLSITAKGKDFERSYPTGPCIVTRDDIDIYNVLATLKVNGEVWATGSTSNPQWTFADCIAYASRHAPLVAGEMISSATVANCSGLEQARMGSYGDVVELCVPEIGVLRNTILQA